MNCLDITRIANTGTFQKLTEAERQAAEVHALACRECAPVWAVHSRLGDLRIPGMPVELSLRCRNLDVAVAHRVRSSARRAIWIGCIAALTAAAGALIWNWLPSQPAAVVASSVPVSVTHGAAPATPPERNEDLPQHPSAIQEEQGTPPMADLPLVPEPAPSALDQDQSALALQKAVERHPELSHGPRLDENAIFLVTLIMRADGTVLESASELASTDTFPEASNRISQTLTADSIDSMMFAVDAGHAVAEDLQMRARAFVYASLVDDDFDLMRADVRVRRILGSKYDDLMTSTGEGGFPLLTVLLSDDGRILREKVERITMQDAAAASGIDTGMRHEEVFATKLGIPVQEIGQIGTTMLEKGSPRSVVDANGLRHLEGVKALAVRYAWARRADEPPAIETLPRTRRAGVDFDIAAALVVVERLIPDALTHNPTSVSEGSMLPTVVFSARGEVIRAGWVQVRNGIELDSLLQAQLVPGVTTRLHRIERLTNMAGESAMVQFAWADD